jgi:hypothetical protein
MPLFWLNDGAGAAKIVRSGSIELDPPGLTIEFEACFNAA